MQGVSLRFYLCDEPGRPGPSAYERLLRHAKRIGIPSGSAFRGIAGFGRHGQMSESHFSELPGNQPVLVEFLLPEEDAALLLESLAAEPDTMTYARSPIEFGGVGGSSLNDSADKPAASS
jgi:PII-like signaling protein